MTIVGVFIGTINQSPLFLFASYQEQRYVEASGYLLRDQNLCTYSLLLMDDPTCLRVLMSDLLRQHWQTSQEDYLSEDGLVPVYPSSIWVGIGLILMEEN